MSEPTKRKFPETKNHELLGLYQNREGIEAESAKRDEAVKAAEEEAKGGHLSTIAGNRIRIAEINKRITSLEKLEPKA